MDDQKLKKEFSCRRFTTLIIGTGAAGYNAADELWSLGQRDIAIVTDHKNAGTSRNTGSDKQTYYKLTLAGGEPDSVREMAKTLYEGQCVDGDQALCEAALSAPCFLKLVNLGVPFPRNRWGEYVGYKTDHDPRRRATSTGPYTSKLITECLERSVEKKGIPIFDKMQVIRILSDKKQVYGLLCLDLSFPEGEKETPFVLFECSHVIYAVGGPAGMYHDSVYPHGHYGASGLAFEAGVKGKNLTEWQFGLSSLKPRWNVSGTYMQVLPRFISTDEEGKDEKEFLADYLKDPYEMLSLVFLKGYQWPFDVRKLKGGSSLIDVCVYLEQNRGRRIFLDYRKNPLKKDIAFDRLIPEAFSYLSQAGACFGTPIDRLRHMNPMAVEFYKSRGVDLEKEPLEIALCAQHNNGGLSTDAWWQTNLKGFFAAGEVSGTHGVYRPGGSALNAGQVGSLRAAQYIAARGKETICSHEIFEVLAKEAIEEAGELVKKAVERGFKNWGEDCEKNRGKNCVEGRPIHARDLWKEASKRMSRCGGPIRSRALLKEALEENEKDRVRLETTVFVKNPGELWILFRLRDVLISQKVYLQAMLDYMDQGGKSRGSALYTEKPESEITFDMFREFTCEREEMGKRPYRKSFWKGKRPSPSGDSPAQSRRTMISLKMCGGDTGKTEMSFEPVSEANHIPGAISLATHPSNSSQITSKGAGPISRRKV